MAALREQLCKVLGRDMSMAALQGGLQMMGDVLGDSCLEVMGMYRKVHLPRGPGEVESPDRDAAFGSAYSGSWEPACTNSLVSMQKEALGQLLGIAN